MLTIFQAASNGLFAGIAAQNGPFPCPVITIAGINMDQNWGTKTGFQGMIIILRQIFY